jgi:Uma2 family endonuclease
MTVAINLIPKEDQTQSEAVEAEAVEAESVEAESVEAESVEAESVEAESVEAESVEAESVEAESVEAEAVETTLTDLPDDLPSMPPCGLYSDEPEMESTLHLRQMLLLIVCLEWLWRDRTDYFLAGNLSIYYSQKQIKNRDVRGPDFFVVRNVEQYPRRSWTIWEEDGRYPDVIIEILSDTTAQVDRTTKKDLYQTTFRTPEYFWFDLVSLEFQGFSMHKSRYQAIAPNSQGWLWSDELQLFLGVQDAQLRYFTPEGELVPTPQEDALAEQQRFQDVQQQLQETAQQLQQTAQRAEQEAGRAAQLAEKLRELGVDPESL